MILELTFLTLDFSITDLIRMISFKLIFTTDGHGFLQLEDRMKNHPG